MRFGQFVSIFVLGCSLVCSSQTSAQSLVDPLNLAVVPLNSHMDQVGWPILAGRNGGWGRFPNYYSYKRVEMDGMACLIDTYPHSQIHGSSNAIRIDWDGDPANGMTPLKITPGMQLEFGVSVYIQPWTHNTLRSHYVRDGTRMVQWRMGPGMVPEKIKPIEDTRKVKDFSWHTQRGPRIGYRVGDVPDHDPTGKPVFEAFSALSDQVHTSMQGSQIACWFDLKLTVQFTEKANTATCQAFFKPTDEQAWQSVGESWTITWDANDKDANNPANWNALILDMPYAQWSTKGYGQPQEHMFDRYRQFTVKVQLPNQHQVEKRTELMRFDRQATACRMLMPRYVFADQPIPVELQVVNASGEDLQGDLLLKAQDSEQLLEKDWTLAPDKQWQALRRFAPVIDLSEMTFELLIRKADGKQQLLAKESCDIINRNLPGPTENVLYNSGFEKTGKYNGSKMYRGYERVYSYAKRGNDSLYTQLPVQSWWALDANADGITVDRTHKHAGEQSLLIQVADKPMTVVSAPGNWLPAGDVTLSAWVRSEQADATLQLNLLTSDDQILPRRVTVLEKQNLPATSDWVRVTMSTRIDRPMQALPCLNVQKGKVWIDDLMVQSSPQATDYAPIPTEWIVLDISGQSADSVPIWSAGDTSKRQLILSSHVPEHLRGYVQISLGTWEKLATQSLGRVALSELHSQKKVSIDFETSQLKPNAYVISADVHLDDGRVIKGAGQFLPNLRIAGSASATQVLSQMVMRFAIAPSYKPAALFGVGNGMLDQHGDHFGGYRFSDYKWAGQLDYICDRGRYTTQKGFLIAAGGIPTHRMESRRLDVDPTRNREIQNPAKGGRLDIWHPDGRKVFLEQAESIGKENGENPQIASYQMANEQPFYGKDGLCPTPSADAAFRKWCQQRHGDLKTLNQRWGTNYTTWQQVEQPLSARQLQVVQSQEKLKGADAIAWTAVYGKMSKQVQTLMQSVPGRGMDWYRWRTEASLEMFTQFREQARKHDTKTLYSTNLCWPNFWPQMAMPFFRAMDVTMLDMEYSAGQKRGLGNPQEMMEIMEMFESNAPGKPMWGIEVYVQPQWPAASAELQNWGLLAHGMTNNLIFGWRPYSDHGRVRGTRAWEKDKAHPMWFLIDNDGTRLPSFDAVEKTKAQIHQFHKRYDGLSLKRYPTNIGIYVSDDTSEYLSYMTANRPYNIPLTASRNTLIYLMRMAGLQADYLDDQLLESKRKQYDTLILPPTPLLSDKAAKQIADFTQRGGKLILVGAAGQLDPWLIPVSPLGGNAWADLNWIAPDYQHRQLQSNGHFRGVNPGNISNAKSIVDSHNQTIGWHKTWGQGHVYVYAVYPSFYVQNPHMPIDMHQWMQRMIELTDLPVNARWINDQTPVYDPKVKHGKGSPVVEVVLRRKSDKEVFAFVLNQGGQGEGRMQCNLPGNWQITDVLTDQAMQPIREHNKTSVKLSLPDFGYRVFRMVKTGS